MISAVSLPTNRPPRPKAPPPIGFMYAAAFDLSCPGYVRLPMPRFVYLIPRFMYASSRDDAPPLKP
jgi:hypothetical protein